MDVPLKSARKMSISSSSKLDKYEVEQNVCNFLVTKYVVANSKLLVKGNP